MKEFKKAGDKVTIEDVYESCRRYITNEDDMKLIKKAYDYIMVKHEGQKRKSGEPYTIHLIWVAYILSTLQTGPLTITAGLLHDVMEDCDVSREEMVKEFGEEVTTLVEGVTKISKMPFKDEADVYAENHRKIYIAMAKDIRVILIKFADRLHNMRTLQFMPPEKQKRISRETLEVYTPIAHRLGLSDIKTELEDLSLSYLDPIAYHDIARLLQTKQDERKESVAKMMEEVENLLKENHYQYRILGRAKSIYSIYKKMFKKHKRFDELYDLYALRIILQNKLDCYSVLGLIKLLNENTDIKKVLEVENIDRVFEVYGQKIYTPNNKIYYAFKFNDITEEYRKNQETKNNEKILSDIIDDIQEMIIALDKDGNIIFLNLTAKKYIGDIDFKQKKINYASLVSNPDQRENFEAKINEKIRYSISIDEGKTIEIESITLKIKDKEISKVDKIILARNPGESNKYNNLLLEYDKFKEHERIKNNFIINLSHEFITPINVIFSVIQLLENVDISDKDQLVSIYSKYKKPVKVNCLRIYRTINNIIDTLRLDYENIEMNFKNINIVELVEEIVTYIAKYSNNINIIFDTEFEEKIVSCDPSKIVKVITNILANAIKFSPNNSEIHINIKCEDSMIIIECIDNGIGISEEMIENIFEPFLQVDNSLRRASEGSGMGLSIAKKLIELHNGSISVESKLGIGSIFRIILPDNCLESSHDNISKIYEVNSKEIDAELSDIYNLY